MPRKKKDKEKIETDISAPEKVAPPPLSAVKPIRSWYDIVNQDQGKADSLKAIEIEKWVESISKTPELVQAIQATLKPPPPELPSILGPSPSGMAPLPISKTEKGESSSSPKPLSQTISTPLNSQNSSQIVLSQSIRKQLTLFCIFIYLLIEILA